MSADVDRVARENFVAGYVTHALGGDERFQFVEADTSVTPVTMVYDVTTTMGVVRVRLSVRASASPEDRTEGV